MPDEIRVRAALTSFIADGALDADLAALLWILTERGVPLVVAADDAAAARSLRDSLADLLPADRRSGDVRLAGGVVAGSSLDDVLHLLGGRPGGDLPDDVRDLGLVVVLVGGRVTAAHYVRPVERDGAGHLQRRPPAVLSARERVGDSLDHFYWSITDELATRAGMTRDELEDVQSVRARLLSDLVAAGLSDDASLRRIAQQATLSTTASHQDDRRPH
jgi:hypothetical protein